MRSLVVALSTIRLLPHLLVLALAPNRDTIRADLSRWHGDGPPGELDGTLLSGAPLAWAFAWTMSLHPEFRNLFYFRVRAFSQTLSYLLRVTCRPVPTLFFRTPSIGPGLFIQHGFSTGITATSIGRDCWINQQVTIGFVDETAAPVLGDRVHVSVGARVLGNITIGDDVIVGANAVVLKDVPSRCVVAGVPAKIIRRDGRRVDEAL